MRLCDAESTVRVALAELATDIILGAIRECAEDEKPLTDGQQKLLLRNGLMDYATHVQTAYKLLMLDDQLFRDREG